MAQHEHDRLSAHGKTLPDAADFYLAHMETMKKSVEVNLAIDELIQNRKASGAGKRYCYDLNLRLKRFASDFRQRLVAEISTAEIDHWLSG